LARERPDKLAGILRPEEIEEAHNYLTSPGISILKDAKIAMNAGNISAMHDPTEGGLATALWEMAEASDRELVVRLENVPISRLARQITEHFRIDPMASLSSGALLFTVAEDDVMMVCFTLEAAGIKCAKIGQVGTGGAMVWNLVGNDKKPLDRPRRDEITRLFE
jgi:hydrogenase maturation factor